MTARHAVGSVVAADVEASARRLVGVIGPSPLQYSARLSLEHNLDVWLKREDLQEVRSYTGRGAYNVIAQLDDAARSRGVTCASAGNHAQGVAFACARAQVHARIYLPRTTPRQKRERVASSWSRSGRGGDRRRDVRRGSGSCP